MAVVTGPPPAGTRIHDHRSYLGCGVRDYLLVEYERSRGNTHLPSSDALSKIAPLKAEVNAGRWIVRCPYCPSAAMADPSDPRFFCSNCGNSRAGGQWLRVTWPSGSLQVKIEAALLARPHPDFMNWEPGMTVAELLSAGPFHRSWTAPRTWVVGEIVTAALLNTHLRDNLLESAPAKGTAAGILYVSAANTLALLAAAGNGSKLVRVNAGGTAMELVDGSTIYLPLAGGTMAGVLTVPPALIIDTGSTVGTTDMIKLRGRNASAAAIDYVVEQMGIDNNGAGTEQGNWLVRNYVAGSLGTRIELLGDALDLKATTLKHAAKHVYTPSQSLAARANGGSTTTSDTYVDVTSVTSGSITTRGGPVKVIVMGRFTRTAGSALVIGVQQDSDAETAIQLDALGSSTSGVFWGMLIFTPAAGAHTYKLRHHRSGGADTVGADTALIMAWEG